MTSTIRARFLLSGLTLALVLTLFSFVPIPVYPQQVSLEALLRQTGVTLHWNPHLTQGLLSRDGITVAFRPGLPWVVLNGEKVIETGIIEEIQGRLIFSAEAAKTLFDIFGLVTQGNGGYHLSTILIDPGHGGRDSGAAHNWFVDGIEYPLTEKDIVLELSLHVEEALKRNYPDKKVMLTRNSDVYPSLEERIALANGVELGVREGMIYLSIHANASLNPRAEGYEVWYLPEDYRRSLVDPKSLGSRGNEIAPIVNALWEDEFTHESIRLADMILSRFTAELGSNIPNRGRREESWFVVRNAKMASVLVEVGFITHKAEAKRLRQPDYLRKISNAIYDGIVDFVNYFESREITF
ncbi:N-acetylmuramoyl-L-alanine amidase [Olavius algarvensis spirochete endosymbiont]|uniref:N-acetylmuramoyl-L-alanine amidase family protein n=1 Tax=Olavius algarvensis spirochete endosymbiont TaxID=260710 RepID=UPI000F2B7482|nr:N-acetylmuramoyl-L-alanine amidase [Olavius algarvensis spirochete endosymbiont]VDA99124.1 N-acetylmuramoyl-L-alanine amidase [Olavius algarvensis spirochete endosymbiont]